MLKLQMIECKKIFLGVLFCGLVATISISYIFRDVVKGFKDHTNGETSFQMNFDIWNDETEEDERSWSITELDKNDMHYYDIGRTEIKVNFTHVDFDINGSDVLVFLHMQKTGGTTFGRQLVSNIKLTKECDILKDKKRRNCMRPNSEKETWIFSRFSTGWACGLHADWTELHECVQGKLNRKEKTNKARRLFYITILREPIKRYLSEWKHVQRGATWKTALFSCNEQQNNIPRCYPGGDWIGVSLREFMSCPYNMASNRQTRMLADLRLVNCYELWLDRNITAEEKHKLEENMLKSAMENLRDMTFFGLLEDQLKTQYIFEHVFPFQFKTAFFQINETVSSGVQLTDEEENTLRSLNSLDIRLYEYASKLFQKRYLKS